MGLRLAVACLRIVGLVSIARFDLLTLAGFIIPEFVDLAIMSLNYACFRNRVPQSIVGACYTVIGIFVKERS